MKENKKYLLLWMCWFDRSILFDLKSIISLEQFRRGEIN